MTHSFWLNFNQMNREVKNSRRYGSGQCCMTCSPSDDTVSVCVSVLKTNSLHFYTLQSVSLWFALVASINLISFGRMIKRIWDAIFPAWLWCNGGSIYCDLCFGVCWFSVCLTFAPTLFIMYGMVLCVHSVSGKTLLWISKFWIYYVSWKKPVDY